VRRLTIILLILLVFGLPVTAIAQEPADGVINGQVINGTEGGGSVAGVEITLITYVDDMMAGTRTARTDGEGKFRFDDIVIEHEYLVSAEYMAVDYYYPVDFESGETVAPVEVWVCDTTASDEAIRVGQAHAIISVEEESLLVTEVFRLMNDGDRTYVGTDGILVFTLPAGVTEFGAPQELMPDYQFLDDNRVAYLVPFPPGERQLVFSYSLMKPESAEITVPLEIDYPTDSFELMVGGEGVEVAVSQLAPAEPVFTDTGERFIHFQGENLLRGTVLDVHISGLSEGGGMFFAVLWVIIAIVIIGIAIYLLKRRKRENTDE